MKIAIVGAGINGLYLAKKLAEKNHKVIVFEKRGLIGKVACSGLFSERIFDFFPESRRLVQNQINFGLIHFPKRTFRINFSQKNKVLEPKARGSYFSQKNKVLEPKAKGSYFSKKFFVMSHYDLDNFAAESAKNAGAEIILNKDVGEQDLSSMKKDFDRIIGSDGPNSQVRKYLKLKNPSFKLGIQGFCENAKMSDYIETWPTKSGFLWKIPRGKEIEYGVFEKPEFAKNIFENFVKEKNIEIKKMESAIIPQGFSIPSHQSITLCGDAAGLTKPWSGGGVIWGLTAADILLNNFPDFLQYKKQMEKFFPPKIFLSKLIIKTGYFLGNNMPWILPKERRIESDFLFS